jgi:23S rRNA (guanosine2251-2'-O)-methyltransferase
MREWIYGRNPVYEVLKAGRRDSFQLLIAQGTQIKDRLADILNLVKGRKLPVEQVPRARLEKIHSHHQGVALETSKYPYAALPDILQLAEGRDESLLILILDTLQDPQNLGTLLRTGEIVGVHGVLLPYRRTATVTPAVVNASSGASEHMLVAQVNLAQAMAELKNQDVWVIGLESGPDAQPLEEVDLGGPLALVVGGEGQGMRSLVRKSCDQLMRLPMRGRVKSLNAAVAGSVALYLAWGARGYK